MQKEYPHQFQALPNLNTGRVPNTKKIWSKYAKGNITIWWRKVIHVIRIILGLSPMTTQSMWKECQIQSSSK